MAATDAPTGVRRSPLGRRNLVVLLVAIVCLIAGYMTLHAGSSSLAAVLLVAGYCVLFPLAIAL